MTNLAELSFERAAAEAATRSNGALAAHPGWAGLKAAVEELRPFQSPDGSVDAGSHDLARATALVEAVVAGDRGARARAAARRRVPGAPSSPTCAAGPTSGFGVPDFLDSLLAFRPERHRVDGLAHLVLFPMYTQNGNPDRNLEAVLLRVVWPDWVAELEAEQYRNPMFVPVAFIDFTGGYDTHSAVLFPETVAVREVPEFTWGAIFCDREAARFRRVIPAAVEALRARAARGRRAAAADQAARAGDVRDVGPDPRPGAQPRRPAVRPVHDQAADAVLAVRARGAALRPHRVPRRGRARAGRREPRARLVQYAILFDRGRGSRSRAPGCATTTASAASCCSRSCASTARLRWTDNRLSVDWDRAAARSCWRCSARSRSSTGAASTGPRSRTGSRRTSWSRPTSSRTRPRPGPRASQALPRDGAPKELVDAVLPDEFPLSMFFETLARKIGAVIESTRGIRASA